MFRLSASGTDAATRLPITYVKLTEVQPEHLLAAVLAEFASGAQSVEIELTAEAERSWAKPS